MHNLTSLIRSPEVIFYDYLKAMVQYVRANEADSSVQETDKYLYRLLNGIKSGRSEWLAIARTILLAVDGDTKALVIDYAYNYKADQNPCIYIEFGSQSLVDRDIGVGEGDYPIFDTGEPVFTRRSEATFNFKLVSGNLIELQVLYQVLLAFFITITPELNLVGMQQINLMGGNIDKALEQIPVKTFTRMLQVKFTYETSAPSLYPGISYTNFDVDGNLVTP